VTINTYHIRVFGLPETLIQLVAYPREIGKVNSEVLLVRFITTVSMQKMLKLVFRVFAIPTSIPRW